MYVQGSGGGSGLGILPAHPGDGVFARIFSVLLLLFLTPDFAQALLTWHLDFLVSLYLLSIILL